MTASKRTDSGLSPSKSQRPEKNIVSDAQIHPRRLNLISQTYFDKSGTLGAIRYSRDGARVIAQADENLIFSSAGELLFHLGYGQMDDAVAMKFVARQPPKDTVGIHHEPLI